METNAAADLTTSRATPRVLPALRLDHLWVLLSLSVIAACISLVPTSPNDFWWHLKAGELIATSGIPTTNLFAWSLPADHPYVYQSWLGEWLFYQLYRLGGFPLVVFARNLLGAAVFALVAVEARLRSGSWRWAALAAFAAAAMAINNVLLRTQVWSWLPFMAVFMLLSRYAEGRLAPRWLAALPLIMAVWVNLHGAFVLGLLVTGTFLAGESLRRALRQPRALPWSRLRALGVAAAAMLAATLLNPLGPGVFGYVRDMLGNAPSQQLIGEWQSPTPRSVAGAAFYLGVLGLIAAFAFARRRPSLTEVLLVCGLGWQAFVGMRYVIWWGMVAMPIAAQALAAPRPVFGAARPSPRERGAGGVANLVVALGLLGLVAALQPWSKPLLNLPSAYRGLFVDLPGAPLLFTTETPVGAVEHLLAQPCRGRIFNEMGYGSYMAWALYPAAQHFIDPRVELFPLALWQEYRAVSEGRDVAGFFDRHAIACAVIDKELQPELARAMPALPGWQRTFGDGRTEVWRR